MKIMQLRSQRWPSDSGQYCQHCITELYRAISLSRSEPALCVWRPCKLTRQSPNCRPRSNRSSAHGAILKTEPNRTHSAAWNSFSAKWMKNVLGNELEWNDFALIGSFLTLHSSDAAPAGFCSAVEHFRLKPPLTCPFLKLIPDFFLNFWIWRVSKIGS